MPRPHHNLDEQLSAYLDGELGADELREVERRLADSPDTRRRLDELRGVSRGLASLPRHAAPAPLDAWARATPAGRGAPRVSQGPLQRRVRVLLYRIGSAAALIALGMITAWLLPPRSAAWRSAQPTAPIESSKREGASPPPAVSKLPAVERPSAGETAVPSLTAGPPPMATEASPLGGSSHGRPATEDGPAVASISALADSEIPHSSATRRGSRDASEPILNIVIAPETVEQYHYARNVLRTWHAQEASAPADGSSERHDVDAWMRADATRAAPGPGTALALETSSQRVEELMQLLDHDKAAAVPTHIMMNFDATQIHLARNLLNRVAGEGATAAGPASGFDTESPPIPAQTPSRDGLRAGRSKKERSADAAGGRQFAASPRGQPGDQSGAWAYPVESRAADERSGGAAAALENAPRARSLEKESAAPAPPPAGPAAQDGRADPQRGASGADAADRSSAREGIAPPSERLPATPPASQQALTALADQVRDAALILGERVDGFLRFALSRLDEEARRLAAESSAAPPDRGAAIDESTAMRLKVTILPPTEPTASRPAER